MTLRAVFAMSAALAVSAQAETYKPAPVAGGIQVTNFNVDTVTWNGSNATVHYHGLQAPYMVQITTNAGATFDDTGVIAALKSPNFHSSVVVPNVDPVSSQFRLMLLGATNWVGKWNYSALQKTNVFLGADKCIGCHGDKGSEWAATKHAVAKDAIFNADGTFKPFRNDSCVVCHTVGKGQPGGFLDMTNTPHLASVGCETCHGPANAHVNISSRQYRPVVSLAPEVCGGCHNDAHHPTYDEFKLSGHYEVSPDVSYGIAAGLGTFNPGTLVTNIGGTNYTWYGYIEYTNGPNAGKSGAASGIYNSLKTLAGITSGFGRQMSCGPCHSAATRAAMLSDYKLRQRGQTNLFQLPGAHEGAEFGPACATCHDPHSADKQNQLRNPKYSTNYFTFFTGSVIATNRATNSYATTSAVTYINESDSVVVTKPLGVNVTTNLTYRNEFFAQQYDPSVQVCAQCHNSRGARWDGVGRSWNYTTGQIVPGSASWQRPPHHSPQYNMLIGIVQPDYLNGTSNIFHLAETPDVARGHSLQTNGCAACHLAGNTVSGPTDLNPNYTGHEFLPLIAGISGTNGCRASGCHDAESAATVSNRMDVLRAEISGSISNVVAMLSAWGTNKGTALTLTKGIINWEFTNPGDLSPTNAGVSGAGPSAAQQPLIPVAIKQARFNLYMAGYGNLESLGIHNPTYTRYLLNDASNKVWQASQ